MKFRSTAIWILATIVACGDGGSVKNPSSSGELSPASETLVDGSARFAIALPDSRVLYANDTDVVLKRTLDDTGVVVSASEDIGELTAWTPIDDVVLIVGTAGSFALRGDDFFRSPVSAALSGMEIRDVVSTPRTGATDDLWIASQAGVALYRDESIQTIMLEGVTLTNPIIASAPYVSGRSVWVSVADGDAPGLYELAFRNDELTASRIVLGFVPTQMAADGAGVLWLLDGEAGEVVAIGLERRWTRYVLPFAVTEIHASSAGPDAWFEGEGSLWHHEGGDFHNVASAGTFLDAGPDGTALVTTSMELRRVRARHPLTLLGPAAGTTLVEETTYSIVLNEPSGVQSVDATLDGEPIDVSSDRDVSINPSELEPGAYALEVFVRYDDGTLPAKARRVFEVGAEANWVDDIAPIYDEQCSDCHGRAGPAPTLLDTRELWIEEFDRILFNIREGRMPLARPALDAKTVALVEAWAASGFPETEADAADSMEDSTDG